MNINVSYDEKRNMILTPEITEEEKEDLYQMDIHALESWICEEFFSENGLRYMQDEEKIAFGDLTDKDIITTLDYMHEYGEDWMNESWIYNYTFIWFVDLARGEAIKFTKRGNL